MILVITSTSCPGLGDIRRLGAGDTVAIRSDARSRKDWARIAGAVIDAVSKGCVVIWDEL